MQEENEKRENKLFTAFVIISLISVSILYYFNRNNIFLVILMLTPAGSVIIAKLLCRQSFNDMSIKPNFKGNVKWYAAAWFLTPVVAYAGAIIYFLIFKSDYDPLGSSYGKISGITDIKQYYIQLAVMIFFAIIINPIFGIIQCMGEELAWRGFLFPRLRKRYGSKKAVILDGIIWGMWHAPIIAMGYNYGEGHPFSSIIAMIVFCTVIGTISCFLFLKTRSVWTSVLFHAAINGIDLYAPSDLFMSKEPNMFVGPDILGVIGGVGFITIVAIILWGNVDWE